MSAPVITVLGSINMDLVVTSPELPEPGQTLLGTGFDTVPGGKGANQAIAAARAGGTVGFIGAVGDDAFGDTLRATLASAGVDETTLRRVPGPSGIAAITVNAAAENTIVVVAGANGSVDDLTPAEQAAVSGSAILVCQLEIPLDTVTTGARTAAAAGVPVLLNPSPVQTLPAELLTAVTILIVNEGEAAALGSLAIAGVPHVITTLGAAGARYRGPDGQTFDVPAPVVTAVDTTGAGDTFAGALAVAWTEGRTPVEAIRFACCAGALATTVAGASVSAPARDRIEALVAGTYGGGSGPTHPAPSTNPPRPVAAPSRAPRRQPFPTFAEFSRRKDFEQLRDLLGRYLTEVLGGVPTAQTDRWVVNTLSEKGRTPQNRPLVTVLCGPAESLVVTEVGPEYKGQVVGFVNIAEPKHFGAYNKAVRALGARAIRFSDNRFGDLAQVNFESLDVLAALLADEQTLALARSLAVTLLNE
ncbi:ribokinase [Nakamurella silvestris]|nr:ribokinase [Nakamurella silvestris]